MIKVQSILRQKLVNLYCSSCGIKLTVKFGDLLEACEPYKCPECGDTVPVDMTVLALYLGDSLRRDSASSTPIDRAHRPTTDSDN